MHDTTLAVKIAHTHDDIQFSSSQFIDTAYAVLHFLYMFVFYLFGLSVTSEYCFI